MNTEQRAMCDGIDKTASGWCLESAEQLRMKETNTETSSATSIVQATTESNFSKESFSIEANCPHIDDEKIVIKGIESSLPPVSDDRENSNETDNKNRDLIVDDKPMTEVRVSENVFTAEEYVDCSVIKTHDGKKTVDAEVEDKDTFSEDVSMEEQYHDEQ